MNRPPSEDARASLLGRASLLLLVAAVIAGIFGMHVVTGSHDTHSANPAIPSGTASPHHVHETSQQMHKTAPVEADKCTSGSCSCTEASSANCIPSLKTGSLAAPPPDTAVAITSDPWGTHKAAPVWSYRPVAPTPVQLSISRT
ncbi:DUF6153 family protein [Paenarthrobacter nitroguajacolicus]|uniref:DUF6153 family protein n=1 Tax=Paenarthrobacter nitroguajacolicus TaxID=211146 RepID=UPI00248B2BF7|nr:DUF6153 family protein [Paenarthrobacter nitroguajacolicus]MDI2035842.1 hypothetical protein [Paenarthrobacter nitroguajacolicus]